MERYLPSFRSANFSVRWSGEVIPRFSETYLFQTLSDDGVRLWVKDELIIDNWTDHAPRFDAGSIDLGADERYPIRLEYYERGGGARIRLMWRSPSQNWQTIPSGRLTSVEGDLPVIWPPYILSVGWTADLLEMRINAEALAEYEVQYSSDLRDWQVIKSFEPIRGGLDFEVEVPENSLNGFFRTVAKY